MRSVSLLLAVAIFTLVAGTMPAAAQINPFRGNRQGPSLSEHDNRMLFDSINRLNRMSPLHVGQTDRWSNPKTGSSGVNTVERIFSSHGMPCHQLRHQIVVQRHQPATTYDMTWCRTAQGEWKSKG